MSELSDRLADAKGDHSIDWIVDRAAEAGHTIHRSVVAKYVSGRHGPRSSEKALAALAAALGLDVRELRELAGRKGGELGTWVPTAESASLTRDERDVLDQLIRVMTRGGRAAGGDPPGGDVGPAGDGNVRELAGRTSRPMPPMDALAADEQDGPTVQDADGDLNRQNEAGEEDQGGPDEPA